MSRDHNKMQHDEDGHDQNGHEQNGHNGGMKDRAHTREMGRFGGLLGRVPVYSGLLALPDGMVGWPLLMALVAAATMSFGNLVSLRQTGLKRLLAYSSIAQAGYALVAVAVADQVPAAISAVGYYLAAYLFMNLGAFTIVAQIERAIGSDAITALRGLGWRMPGAAAALLFSLLSLAGFPPLAGFIGKVLLLSAAIEGGASWLAVVAIINFAVALYYYIAIAAEMYLKRPQRVDRLPGGTGYALAAGMSMLGTFILGILPGPGLSIIGRVSELL